MRCSRAMDSDLLSGAIAWRSPEWQELELHSRDCADCASELALFQGLGSWVQEEAAHPADADLLALSQTPADLSPQRHAELTAHVRSCFSCRTAYRAFDKLDLGELVEELREPEPSSQGRRGRPRDPSRWLDRLREFFSVSGPAPVWAAAGLAAVAVAVGVGNVLGGSDSAGTSLPAPSTPGLATPPFGTPSPLSAISLREEGVRVRASQIRGEETLRLELPRGFESAAGLSARLQEVGSERAILLDVEPAAGAERRAMSRVSASFLRPGSYVLEVRSGAAPEPIGRFEITVE